MQHAMTPRRGWIAFGLALMVGGAIEMGAARAGDMPPASELLDAAVSPDEAVADKAIETLRAQGPAALDALIAAHADEIRRHFASPLASAADRGVAWQSLSHAVDKVAAQRDASTSGLYWYTDLAAAESAARAAGKPILSLRLLGKLDEDLSCANSRFFRTVLYANADVSRTLRERFILHWKSERPVPVVTIDFGDGRKIRRTITGNSIHYILDADGQVIDAIPGLYGPEAFLKQIMDAAAIIKQASVVPSEQDRQQLLSQWHRERKTAEDLAYRSDLGRIGGVMALKNDRAAQQPGRVNSPPPAAVAGKVARGKNAIEGPMVVAVAPAGMTAADADDAIWARIGALHASEAKLDPSSVALLGAKNAAVAARVAVSKMKVESPLLRIVRNFQTSVAIDTVRNEYLLHPSIHTWLANEPKFADMETLNTKVYAELFLTPRSDPWLGLVAPDTYTALDDDQSPTARAQ